MGRKDQTDPSDSIRALVRQVFKCQTEFKHLQATKCLSKRISTDNSVTYRLAGLRNDTKGECFCTPNMIGNVDALETTKSREYYLGVRHHNKQ